MDAMEAILTRRSVRKYSKKPLSNEIVKELLEAAMCAPSAGNEQPWHFIIIDDPQILGKVPSFHNHAQMLKDASIAILVCGDMNLDKHNGMWIQDCSAATENILINLPDHVMPFSLISIGYPAETQKRVDRYNTSRIHKNKW